MRSSFWFVPALMVVDAVVLALLLITLDTSVDLHLAARWPLLFGAVAAGACGLLTTVASSMITVAGLVFSITLVALSLTSSRARRPSGGRCARCTGSSQSGGRGATGQALGSNQRPSE